MPQEYFGADIKQYAIADANMFGAIFIPIQWKVSSHVLKEVFMERIIQSAKSTCIDTFRSLGFDGIPDN